MKRISTKEVMALVNNELYSEDIKNIKIIIGKIPLIDFQRGSMYEISLENVRIKAISLGILINAKTNNISLLPYEDIEMGYMNEFVKNKTYRDYVDDILIATIRGYRTTFKGNGSRYGSIIKESFVLIIDKDYFTLDGNDLISKAIKDNNYDLVNKCHNISKKEIIFAKLNEKKSLTEEEIKYIANEMKDTV